MEKEERIQRYLERVINENSEGKVSIWEHKHLVNVDNENLFHNMAENTDLNSLYHVHGGLHYILEMGAYPWTFALDNDKTQDFLSKYGDQYLIN